MGGMGREMGGRFKREEIYVHIWLIYVNVWQKPTKFCKAIILKCKNKFKIKKKKEINCPRRHSADKARDFISKSRGRQQKGKGTQEDCSFRFYGDGLSFWVVSGQSF